MTSPAPSPAHPGAAAPSGAEASLLGLLNVVLRYRVMIALLALAVGILWALIAFITPRTYTSTMAFMPSKRSAGQNLPGVVAQLGLNLGGMEGTASPEFYVELARSRPILKAVAEDTFAFRNDAGAMVRGTLADVYRIEHARPELAREDAIRYLRRDLSTGSDMKTGIVTVAVKAQQPAVAEQVADRLLQEIHEFNARSRQEQAAADRRFAEARLAEIEAQLRNAEDRVQRFREVNRDTRAPRLAMQLDRLERDVTMQQSMYNSVAQNYAQAKIDELRDTPVIMTIQEPETPVLPDKRGMVMKLLVGLVLGAMLGVILAFILDYFRRSRSAVPRDFEEFSELRRAAVGDLLHPWRPVQRAFTGKRRA